MPTVITGMRATGDLSTQRLKVDIGSGIALLDPNESPFTLITSKMGEIAAKQPKHSHLEDVLQPETDRIDKGAGYTSTNTVLTVDNGSYYAVDDLWQVFDSYEIMRVASKSSNDITFVRNAAGVSSGEVGFPTALVDNDWLIRLGNVNEEGATAPTAKSTVETQVDNFTQIVRTPFELTETELNSLMEGEQDLPYQTRKKGIEHARELEYLSIWGIPNGTNTGSNGKAKRMMGGLWWYLKQNAPAENIVSETQITKAEFLLFLRNGFRYGSRKKIFLCAPIIASAIESWALSDLQTRPSDETFGINTRNWISPHGEIAIVIHKMLEGPEPGTAGGWGFLLDMASIKSVHLKNRNTKLLTGRQANDQDSQEAEYLSEKCIELKNPAKHAVLYNVTSFAA